MEMEEKAVNKRRKSSSARVKGWRWRFAANISKRWNVRSREGSCKCARSISNDLSVKAEKGRNMARRWKKMCK